MAEMVGFLAGILTTIAPFLQAVKTIRSRRTQDLSFGMWLAQTGGNVLWFTYGCSIVSWPVIAANAATMLCAAAVLAVIVGNRMQKRSKS